MGNDVANSIGSGLMTIFLVPMPIALLVFIARQILVGAK